MRILVLGGTYFLGRSFVKAAEARGDEVFFINRGNRREILSESELRNTYFLDRHDIKALSEVDPGHIDVLVDFCAYNEGDIRLILENAGFSIGQYIFVSTTDVYRRGTGKLPVTEDAEFESRDFGGEAGGYILGKVALEKEVRKLISEKYKGVHFTVIRPAFIYGRDIIDSNTRADVYFLRQVLNHEDIVMYSEGKQIRSYLYVKDCVSAMLFVLLSGKSGEAYNIGDMHSAVTLREYAEKLAEKGGVKVILDLNTKPQNMVFLKTTQLILDTSKLQGLGWKAQYDLDAGIEDILS